MAFFDFLADHPKYKDDQYSIDRLNTRHKFIIEPYVQEIKGARVLDLAAHDGRWSYALASAGAKFVHGVEGRQSLIDQFKNYPNDDARGRVKLERNDIFDAVRRMVKKRRRFDVIAVYGIFYHITEHYHLLLQLKKLRPRLIIIDSLFTSQKTSIIHFSEERSEKDLNSIQRDPGQDVTMIGTPSRPWMNLAADVLEYDAHWADWTVLPEDERSAVHDYYRKKFKRRGTVALCPQNAEIP